MGLTGLSEAGWTALAAMFAALMSFLSAVLVTLLRRQNTAQHDRALETQTRLVELYNDLAGTLADHIVNEAERYATLTEVLREGFAFEDWSSVYSGGDDDVDGGC